MIDKQVLRFRLLFIYKGIYLKTACARQTTLTKTLVALEKKMVLFTFELMENRQNKPRDLSLLYIYI